MARTTSRLALLVAAMLAVAAQLQAASVTVAWDPNPEPNVRYVVWWGTQHQNYTSNAAAGSATSYVVNNLAPGQTYYFAVQATTLEGLASPFSDEVTAVVPTTADDLTRPALTITSHGDGTTVTTRTITLTGTASDAGLGDNGIASVLVNGSQATGGTATGSATASWSLPLMLNNGANLITAVARDGSASRNATTRTFSVTCDCPSTPAVRSLTSSSSFPAVPGIPMTWTATAVGGTSPLEYRFYLYSEKAGGWTILQDYSPANEVSWLPAEIGKHAVQVWVRSSGSTATYQDWKSSGYFSVGSDPQVTAFDVEPAGPVRVGTAVTLTATVSGGLGPLQYQFWVRDAATAQWSALGDYGTSNQAVFTPSAVGKYAVQVWVRNAGSSARYDTWAAATPVEATSRVSLESFSANVTAPVAVGTPVTWTAVAGGAPGVEYKFWLLRAESPRWAVLRDYAADGQVTWTPSQAGTYSLQVWVREAGSSAQWEAWKGTSGFVVTAADSSLVIDGIAADRSLPLSVGTTVNFDARSRGGVGPVQYQFWLYDSNSSAWSLLQDYSESSRAQWTPTTPGNYAVQVWGRNAGSAARYDAWKGTGYFDVLGPRVTVTSFTPDVSFPVLQGTPVLWSATASASNGAALEYEFWLHDQAAAAWTLLQPWSSGNTLSWTPTRAGTYHLQVWARIAGTTVRYDAWKGTTDLIVR